MAHESLRILTTTDFFGSYFAQTTSYGRLPGGAGLVRTVERLREEALASLWLDTGDFSQGGPLAPISAGTLGFASAARLGIDAAVVGNHDLDWGTGHLRRWAPELGFPLLAGNYGLGYAGTTVCTAGPWSVGVVGVSHPTLDVFNPTLPPPSEPMGDAIIRLSRDLRDAGVDFIVAAIHDGVDSLVAADGASRLPTSRMEELCGALRGHVDAVLGGHTLQRYVGELAGVPFVQPWAFGAEVGVVDLSPNRPAATAGVWVEEAGQWTGPGSLMREVIADDIVGVLPSPLTNAPGGDISLLAAFAFGMLATTGADATLSGGWDACFSQPPVDGAVAYLPAGPVSEADLLRVVPFVGDVVGGRVFVAEIRPDELSRLETEYHAAYELGPPAIASRGHAPASLALSEFHTRFAEQALGRDLSWKPTGMGLRDALRDAVSGSAGDLRSERRGPGA